MKKRLLFFIMQFFVATKLQNKYGPPHSGIDSVALRHLQVFVAIAALVASNISNMAQPKGDACSISAYLRCKLY